MAESFQRLGQTFDGLVSPGIINEIDFNQLDQKILRNEGGSLTLEYSGTVIDSIENPRHIIVHGCYPWCNPLKSSLDFIERTDRGDCVLLARSSGEEAERIIRPR